MLKLFMFIIKWYFYVVKIFFVYNLLFIFIKFKCNKWDGYFCWVLIGNVILLYDDFFSIVKIMRNEDIFKNFRSMIFRIKILFVKCTCNKVFIWFMF